MQLPELERQRPFVITSIMSFGRKASFSGECELLEALRLSPASVWEVV
jgi:hypothetical protein